MRRRCCLLPIVEDIKPVERLRIRSKRARCFTETATNGTCAWHVATAAEEVVTYFRPCRSRGAQDTAARLRRTALPAATCMQLQSRDGFPLIEPMQRYDRR